jgi:hypothetical protein
MGRFWFCAYSAEVGTGFANQNTRKLTGLRGADEKIAGTTDISLIFKGFSSGFKTAPASQPELTKPVPSTIVPAKSIGSSS